jgi:uroporphyrin-3 C-methyltransferase
MSDPIPTHQSADLSKTELLIEAVPATQAPSKRPLGDMISRVTLTQLTLVVLVVIFVWQWLDARYQLNQVQQEVARRLSEVEGNNKANQVLVTQNQELVRELGGKLSVLENKFAETQNQRASMETLYQEMSSSRDQMALAEVEQMLLIAGQQLQLANNVKAALIAMQHADSRLQRLNRPGFIDLHNRIGSDIERLRALPSIDVPGINQMLDRLINAVDGFPLAQDVGLQAEAVSAEQKPESSSSWKTFWHEIWQGLRSLVRIEYAQQEEMPLLSPTQTFFLRENLKMRLLSARLALLARDEPGFHREMKTAQAWTKRYFDNKSGITLQATSSMQRLSASHITIEVPDISASLEAVRNYRAAHERGTR